MANLVDVHPELRRRLQSMQADPTWARLGCVLVSGARTYAQQKELFRRYKAGTGNLAADPDRVNAAGRRGSNHMVQAPLAGDGRGWGFALDISVRPRTQANMRALEQLANRCGAVRTVPSEYWHFEPTEPGTTRAYRYPDAVLPWDPNAATAGEAKQVWQVGDGPAEFVLNLQETLRDLGFFDATPTGRYGEKTRAAVEAFQRQTGVAVDGKWGPDSEKAGVRLLAERGFDVQDDLSPSTPYPGGVFKLGSRGAFVDDIQTFCLSVNCDPMGVDGKFEENTERAVRCAQEKLHLPVNGVWDDVMQRAVDDFFRFVAGLVP